MKKYVSHVVAVQPNATGSSSVGALERAEKIADYWSGEVCITLPSPS
jgi:hypothetical protein